MGYLARSSRKVSCHARCLKKQFNFSLKTKLCQTLRFPLNLSRKKLFWLIFEHFFHTLLLLKKLSTEALWKTTHTLQKTGNFVALDTPFYPQLKLFLPYQNFLYQAAVEMMFETDWIEKTRLALILQIFVWGYVFSIRPAHHKHPPLFAA